MSMDRLIQGILDKINPTVVGLDPKLDYIPEPVKKEAFSTYGETLEGAAEAFLAFNKGIIDSVHEIVPAVKPQAAFYEALGWQGVRVLVETIAYARKKGLFVILDGKRNDIGSTMAGYADAYLGQTQVGKSLYTPFDADALTVNGYLGSDGINPLLQVCGERDRAIFVLAKTSNPSSGELQDKIVDGTPVYRQMGNLCEAWGEANRGKWGYSSVGAVVGATYPKQLQELREALPHTFFLVPGYGAQGGGAEDVIPAFDSRGLGAVVNSSRGILCAWKKEGTDDFAGAARREAIRMRDDIVQYLPKM